MSSYLQTYTNKDFGLQSEMHEARGLLAAGFIIFHPFKCYYLWKLPTGGKYSWRQVKHCQEAGPLFSKDPVMFSEECSLEFHVTEKKNPANLTNISNQFHLQTTERTQKQTENFKVVQST